MGSTESVKIASATEQVVSFQQAPPPKKSITSLLLLPPRTHHAKSVPREQPVVPPGFCSVQESVGRSGKVGRSWLGLGARDEDEGSEQNEDGAHRRTLKPRDAPRLVVCRYSGQMASPGV